MAGSGVVACAGQGAGFHGPVAGHGAWGGAALGTRDGGSGELDGLSVMAEVVGLVAEVAEDAGTEHAVVGDLGQAQVAVR
ncbi:hypothetical protein GCM10023336_69050 [Streptomyces similanensis]|uniref:Uncharacterized protein n=1 Tax=Streptomyces similanensis TaxID=1274988 RepID=A0ABP9LGZ7_9ACTN